MTTKTDSFDRSAVDGFVHSHVDERNRPIITAPPEYKALVLVSYAEDGGSGGLLAPPAEITWAEALAEGGHGIGYLTQSTLSGGYYHWAPGEVGNAVWAYDLAALRQQAAFWNSQATGFQLRLGVLHGKVFIPAINAYVSHQLSPSGMPSEISAYAPVTLHWPHNWERNYPELLQGLQTMTSDLVAPPEEYSLIGVHLNWSFISGQAGGVSQTHRLAANEWERWASATYPNAQPVQGVPAIAARPPFDHTSVWTEEQEALRFRWLLWVAYDLNVAMRPLGPPPLLPPFGWLEGH